MGCGLHKGDKGTFPEKMHVEIIKAVHELIPIGCDVIVLGDGEWYKLVKYYIWLELCLPYS